MDWEHDLASAIVKSNKDLHNIYAEVQSKRRRQMNESCSRRPMFHPPTGLEVFNDVLNNIENTAPGPHQKAAIDAFHATRNGMMRPLSRGHRMEARAQQSVDDKLVSSSRAIDALRDQLSALANEVRELNRNTSSQERRVDVLCNDSDRRRGIVDKMEAHMSDEASWRKIVGSEIGRLKEALAQQQEDIATKAALSDLKAGFEATRQSSSLSIDAAVSPLQLAMRKEMNAMKEEMERQLSDGLEKQRKEMSNSIHAFQRNLVETIQRAVQEECIKAVEKKAQELQSRGVKETVKIVTAAVVKLESKLKKDMLEKLENKLKGTRQRDAELIIEQMKIELSGELSPIKEALKQTTLRQTLCISKKKTEALVESCRSGLAEDMNQLEGRLVAAISRNEKDDTLKAMTVSLSSHDALLKRLENDNAANSEALSTCITGTDAEAIAQAKAREQYEVWSQQEKGSKPTASADDVERLINECRAQLKSDVSTQLECFVTREEASSIAESKAKELSEQRTKPKSDALEDSTIDDRIQSCEDRVTRDFSSQLQSYITKEEAGEMMQLKIDACEAKLMEEASTIVERVGITKDTQQAGEERILSQIHECREGLMRDIECLESRVDDVEGVSAQLERVLDVLDSFGERVQVVETTNSALDKQFLSQLDDKAELESKVASLQEVLEDFPSKLGDIAEMLFAYEQKPEKSYDGKTLRRSIANLHSTLREAKDLAGGEGTSLAETPLPSIHAEGCTPSSLVHLMGLGSPGSDDIITPAKPGLTSEDSEALSSIARTLSDAARKRGDSSLSELAAGLRARKLAAKTNGPEESSSPDSADESIDTAKALSMCGVHLENTVDESESPTSIAGSMETAEALALCGMRGTADRHKGESGSERDLPTESPEGSPEQPPLVVAAPDNQTSADQSQQDAEPLDSKSRTESDLSACVDSDDESGSSEDESVPGSITSFDEIAEIEIPNNVQPSNGDELPSSHLTPAERYNPTRRSNPDPHEGWDTLLTELRASGRILRDSEGKDLDSKSVSSRQRQL